MKNKKADIAITILVVGIIALCVFALLSFYLFEKKQKSGEINSAFYLEGVYNIAESMQYSGENSYKNYETNTLEIIHIEENKEEQTPENFEINGKFLGGDLNIKYDFKR